MKFNSKKYILALGLALGLGACSEELTDLNINPNSPTNIPAEYLLTQAQFGLNDRFWGRGLNVEVGMLMTQQWAQNEYNEESRYEHVPTTFNGDWAVIYTGGIIGDRDYGGIFELVEAERIISSNEEEVEVVKNNKLAVLKIMKAWAFHNASDVWGDLPYSEAFDLAIRYPKYDSQESIYTALLQELDNALSMINEGAATFASGDVVYDNNLRQWKKFANALKARIGLRMIDANASTGRAAITSAFAGAIFTSSADDAKFVFAADLGTSNPLYFLNEADGRDDYCVSEYLVEKLKASSDPRLSKFVKPVGEEFVGMPYGLSDAAAFALKDKTSRPADLYYQKATAPATMMSYTELLFIQAEAIQRGILSGDAEAVFKQAILSSMADWGVDTAEAEAYANSVSYDAGNYKMSIGEQKYLALYGQGLQAWAEWRRLDYPQLSLPATASVSQIPVRMLYPQSEINTNEAAVFATGFTSDANQWTAQKMWWDKF